MGIPQCTWLPCKNWICGLWGPEDDSIESKYVAHIYSCRYTNKTKLFCFVGTDHLRAKFIINDEILEQVNLFTYLGCSLSYQCSNNVEFN